VVAEKIEFEKFALSWSHRQTNRQTHRQTHYECRSSLCFSWDLMGLGFDGSWIASLDGKMGWARLTEKSRCLSRFPRVINSFPNS
jgi:hypothetical protein